MIIKGVTGCGKTTQVPQFIFDSYAERKMHCNIVVTQPRRLAAVSVAKRVCQERGCPLGSLVGYQVNASRVWNEYVFDLIFRCPYFTLFLQIGQDRKANDDTRILYCTTGILLQKLVSTKRMTDYTHVILDEIHERDQEMDFLLLVVRKLLNTNSRNVKVSQ